MTSQYHHNLFIINILLDLLTCIDLHPVALYSGTKCHHKCHHTVTVTYSEMNKLSGPKCSRVFCFE